MKIFQLNNAIVGKPEALKLRATIKAFDSTNLVRMEVELSEIRQVEPLNASDLVLWKTEALEAPRNTGQVRQSAQSNSNQSERAEIDATV